MNKPIWNTHTVKDQRKHWGQTFLNLWKPQSKNKNKNCIYLDRRGARSKGLEYTGCAYNSLVFLFLFPPKVGFRNMQPICSLTRPLIIYEWPSMYQTSHHTGKEQPRQGFRVERTVCGQSARGEELNCQVWMKWPGEKIQVRKGDTLVSNSEKIQQLMR